MSALLLVRHASCDALGARLNGRLPGVRLTSQGRVEAERLAQRLSNTRTILTSPRERCRETADAIATRARAAVETIDDLDEIDFGAWSGRSFEDLAADPAWNRWNRERACALTPSGDNMAAAQQRMRRALALAVTRTADGPVVIVTHGEPLRAAIADILGFPVDAWAALEISPASITSLDAAGKRVLSINETLTS